MAAEGAGTGATANKQDRSMDGIKRNTTEMLMPRNYLEIPEPRIPVVFLELAEEARNVILVDG